MRFHSWRSSLSISITLLVVASADDSSVAVRAAADHESPTDAAGGAQAYAIVQHGIGGKQYLDDGFLAEAKADGVVSDPTLVIRRHEWGAASDDGLDAEKDRAGLLSGASREGSISIFVSPDASLGIVDDTEGVDGAAGTTPMRTVEADSHGAVRPHAGGAASKEDVLSNPVSRLASASVDMSKPSAPSTPVPAPAAHPVLFTAVTPSRPRFDGTLGMEEVTDGGVIDDTEGVPGVAPDNQVNTVDKGNHGSASLKQDVRANRDGRASSWIYGIIFFILVLCVFVCLVVRLPDPCGHPAATNDRDKDKKGVNASASTRSVNRLTTESETWQSPASESDMHARLHPQLVLQPP